MPPEAPDLNTAIVGLAGAIAHLPPGDLASLRRMTPGEGAPAFWRLYHRRGLADQLGAAEDWEFAAKALALLSPAARGGEQPEGWEPRLPLGRALHQAGVSHLRLARLLSTRHPARRESLVRLARRLAREDMRPDARQLVRLMLFESPETARALARDYYAAEVAAEKADGETTDA